MAWLLDTPVLLELIQRDPDPGVVAWAKTVHVNEVDISAVSIMELERFASAVALSNRDTAAQIRVWIDNRIRPTLSVVPVEPFGAQIAGDFQASGAPIVQTIIAGGAAALGSTVVTKDVSDYAGLPGLYVSPWTEDRTER